MSRFFALFVLISAAHGAEEQLPTVRVAIVKKAVALIGYRGSHINVGGRVYPYDCSGFVQACYQAADIHLRDHLVKNLTSRDIALSLYRSLKSRSWKDSRRQPRPGDLVFFTNTYDRNRNGRWDDFITHVGLVEKVVGNGTVYWIHLSRRGIVRYRMNLSKPKVHQSKGVRFNDFLRVRPKTDPNRTRYLSSNLFAGYASLW